MHLPTLTAVLLSSSEALLPPGLLLTLMRLELRFGRIIALMGRATPFAGEPGGEVAMCAAYGSAVVCERECVCRPLNVVLFMLLCRKVCRSSRE
jgi:hypothetical protein